MIALFTAFASIPKPVKIGLAAIAGALFLWGAFTIYVNGQRRAAVEADRQEAALVASERARGAERAATVNQAQRDDANRTADKTTRKDIDDAIAQNPEQARVPAGPVTRAATDRLRERAARNDTAANIPR